MVAAKKAPAPPPATLELKANPPVPVDTGLGNGGGASSPPAMPSGQFRPAASTVDTGEAEQADAELDAAINALLPQ